MLKSNEIEWWKERKKIEIKYKPYHNLIIKVDFQDQANQFCIMALDFSFCISNQFNKSTFILFFVVLNKPIIRNNSKSNKTIKIKLSKSFQNKIQRKIRKIENCMGKDYEGYESIMRIMWGCILFFIFNSEKIWINLRFKN